MAYTLVYVNFFLYLCSRFMCVRECTRVHTLCKVYGVQCIIEY